MAGVLLWLLSGCGGAAVTPEEPKAHGPIIAESRKDRCPLDIALEQVGVAEYGGNNRGPEVKAYLASVNLGEGHPWCAASIHWCYRQCGTVLEPAREYAMAQRFHRKEARVWERKGWEPSAGDWKRISEDGDHFALWYESLGRIGHTGLIYKEDEKWVYTAEGNTSDGGSRDGDGFYLRKRLKRTLYCISRHKHHHDAKDIQPGGGLRTDLGARQGGPL